MKRRFQTRTERTYLRAVAEALRNLEPLVGIAHDLDEDIPRKVFRCGLSVV